ncbi:MAG TPA: peptidyl-prolyl cis-trans isomerase [Armatimonadota bacterium]|nr:peptidyl-prolyl cis-trans isomerase [Armatimonadota bacterium]
MRSHWLTVFVIAFGAIAVGAAAAEDVVVVVNGESITREALAHRLLDLGTTWQAPLEEMVNETLLFQESRKQGITVSEAELDQRVASIRKKLGTEDDLARYLASQELTEPGLRNKLRVKFLVEKMLGAKATVTDGEVKDIYEKNKASFDTPETVTLRMILTATKERSEQAIKRLDKGESFAQVAKTVSEHTLSAQNGGLIGKRSRASLPPPLAAAAFQTEVGAHTQPIGMEDGYYILKVEERTAAKSPSFDDVKAVIRENLQESRLLQAFVAWLKEAHDNASIERKWHP